MIKGTRTRVSKDGNIILPDFGTCLVRLRTPHGRLVPFRLCRSMKEHHADLLEQWISSLKRAKQEDNPMIALVHLEECCTFGKKELEAGEGTILENCPRFVLDRINPSTNQREVHGLTVGIPQTYPSSSKSGFAAQRIYVLLVALAPPYIVGPRSKRPALGAGRTLVAALAREGHFIENFIGLDAHAPPGKLAEWFQEKCYFDPSARRVLPLRLYGSFNHLDDWLYLISGTESANQLEREALYQPLQ